MNEETISKQAEKTVSTQQPPDQLSDILLVLDKDKKKIQAVKGVDEMANCKLWMRIRKPKPVYACR